jgi:hypothetical protein
MFLKCEATFPLVDFLFLIDFPFLVDFLLIVLNGNAY